MKTTGNTILITGGGSGIGRGLAQAFLALGNNVIIAGRRNLPLEGAAYMPLDIADAAGIRSFTTKIGEDYPALNVLINNAGIMRVERLEAQQEDLADAEAIVATNLLGPIRLTAALLPHLLKQSSSAIMNVSSGLGFVPLSLTPTYCATKAALHSYTESLRYQLRKSSIDIVELIPPYVATDLLGGASDPRAMPLDQFIAQVMEILTKQPEATEIVVENARRLRFAAASAHYDQVFAGLNSMFE